MQERFNLSSGSAFETTYGYSRAVRVGPHIAVAGTVGTRPDGSVPDGAYEQARAALARIAAALESAGASTADVVRTRMYVVDIHANAEAVGRAHAEVFGDVRPVASMIGAAALISPEFVVEIEAEALTDGHC
jgi:enamine deaminase RidA (YjgF/YER057c/UK114 family)